MDLTTVPLVLPSLLSVSLNLFLLLRRQQALKALSALEQEKAKLEQEKAKLEQELAKKAGPSTDVKQFLTDLSTFGHGMLLVARVDPTDILVRSPKQS